MQSKSSKLFSGSTPVTSAPFDRERGEAAMWITGREGREISACVASGRGMSRLLLAPERDVLRCCCHFDIHVQRIGGLQSRPSQPCSTPGWTGSRNHARGAVPAVRGGPWRADRVRVRLDYRPSAPWLTKLNA